MQSTFTSWTTYSKALRSIGIRTARYCVSSNPASPSLPRDGSLDMAATGSTTASSLTAA